ncbi:MAG: ion transporter [Anaerostipes sp.]|nr:ion transporter [Anaerostipes sp.]
MRRRIYQIIGPRNEEDVHNKVYNMFIVIISICSIIPLTFLHPQGILKSGLLRLETITVYLLFLDYFLCWLTNDYRVKSHSPWAFILYPLSPIALLNILSLLPSLGLLPMQFTILRLCRMLKVMQYSKSCSHIVKVFKKEKKTLFSVLIIAIFYIFLSALIMFIKEGGVTFHSFFDALYWATTALTTVGYGDVYPTTTVGRLISMISSLFGIAVIALPAGIVTAGFVDSITQEIKHDEELKKEKKLKKLQRKEKNEGTMYQTVVSGITAAELQDAKEIQQKIEEYRNETAKLERKLAELKFRNEKIGLEQGGE